jgi:SNF2 family DNA or RNA helicase
VDEEEVDAVDDDGDDGETVKGLSVKLRPYQSESVRFMLEEERSALGFITHFWATMFTTDGSRFYYSPILNQIRRDSPVPLRGENRLTSSKGNGNQSGGSANLGVRRQGYKGGLLCEEMGLGKTIETLALIIKNPRPDGPQDVNLKGGPKKNAKKAADVMDVDMGMDRSTGPRLIGGGTLVVCAVSLVGQWISETKDKCRNEDGSCPLRIYCYHGGNRKKCPELLAAHDLVVTTYTIAGTEFSSAWKDSLKKARAAGTAGAGKWTCTGQKDVAGRGKHPNRTVAGAQKVCGRLNPATHAECETCSALRPGTEAARVLREDKMRPALECVMWHRIVLDESHYIKSPGTNQSKSMLALQATNRWCVSGTPFNTKSSDLWNQLHFLGCKDICTSKSMWENSLDRCSSNGEEFTRLLYVLHCIGMRHSCQQKRSGRKLLELPPKTELEVEVTFSAAEKAAYASLQLSVQTQYNVLKERCAATRRGISSKTLQVMALLLPLRKACSATDDIHSLRPVVTEVADDDAAAKGKGKGPTKVPDAADGADSMTECSICLEVLENPCRTPCGHTYCFECISASLQRSNDAHSCPQCRKSCTVDQLVPVTLAAPSSAGAGSGGGAGGSTGGACGGSTGGACGGSTDAAAGATVPMLAKWKKLKEQVYRRPER